MDEKQEQPLGTLDIAGVLEISPTDEDDTTFGDEVSLDAADMVEVDEGDENIPEAEDCRTGLGQS